MKEGQGCSIVLGVALSALVSVHAADALKPENATSPEDLGVYGAVFPVQENSLLDVIQSKLQALKESGEMEVHQKAIADKTREKVMRPDPVEGIHKTTKVKSFTYDPSLTVPYDLKDHEENVFQPKGTRVNPLDHYTFARPFLFLDGDDGEQVAWADREYHKSSDSHKPKIILVKGQPFDLSKKLNFPVYFDQSGILVKKFGIRQVPARVSQHGKTLLIEELRPEEEKEP